MKSKKLQQLRRQAFTAQNCLCFYCQLPMWEEDQEHFVSGYGVPPRLAKHLKCTAEHLVARQNQGKDTSDNIVAACLWCNRLRHKGRQHNAPEPTIYKSKIVNLISQGKWHPVIESMSTQMPATR